MTPEDAPVGSVGTSSARAPLARAARRDRSSRSLRRAPIRVLFIATAYPRHPGDVITPWLGELLRRLPDVGVHAEVLAPAYRGSPTHAVDGITVHRFRYAPAPLERLTHERTTPDQLRAHPAMAALVPGYLAAASLAAVRLTRDRAFDAAHALWPLPHGAVGLAARRANGIPLVSTFFGAELRWMRTVMRPVVAGIARGSDAVTAISSHTAVELQRAAPGVAVDTIPFGAAVAPAVAPGGEPSAAAVRDGAPFRLLFAGRLVERKGVAVLLRALARVQVAAGWQLDVAGDGPERARLEALAGSLGLGGHVRFHGFVDTADLAALYATCDAVVLPAVVDSTGDTEGLGVTLIEAAMHAKPAIASRTGGIVDVVVDGETGLLVTPGDDAALARAIETLARDPGRAATMGAHARVHASDRFGWPRILADLRAVYDRVRRA